MAAELAQQGRQQKPLSGSLPWDEELSSPHHHGTGRMGFGGRAPALQRGLFFPALPSLIQLLSPALVWGKKGVFGVWLQVWGFFSPVST